MGKGKSSLVEGALRVAELASRIYVHAALRQVRCIFCGTFHEHQYVAAGLFNGDRHLGDICPRCMLAGPVEAVNRMRDYINRWLGQSGQAQPPEGGQAGQIRGPNSPGAPSLRTALPQVMSREATQLPPSGAEMLALADALMMMDRWTITLEELQQAEKSALRQRFSGLREDDLRRLVDDRYQEFLEQTPDGHRKL